MLMILMRLMECEVEAGDGGGDEKRREIDHDEVFIPVR